MNSPSDWTQVFKDTTVPDSCCKELLANSGCDANSIHLNEDGCKMRLQSAIESSALILGGVGIGIALVQVSWKSHYITELDTYNLDTDI